MGVGQKRASQRAEKGSAAEGQLSGREVLLVEEELVVPVRRDRAVGQRGGVGEGVRRPATAQLLLKLTSARDRARARVAVETDTVAPANEVNAFDQTILDLPRRSRILARPFATVGTA